MAAGTLEAAAGAAGAARTAAAAVSSVRASPAPIITGSVAEELSEPVEGVHHGVNSLVTNFQAALFRDFPDPHRVYGAARF